jgi:hypothetical protein
MKNARLMAMGCILLFLIACAPNLVPPGWEFLGKRDVSFGADHDVFRILPRERALHRLLIVVKMNDVELFDFSLTGIRRSSTCPEARGASRESISATRA